MAEANQGERSKTGMTSLLREWGGFLKRQDSPFKVNILKNLAARFAVNLTFQYRVIYLSLLGANPLILGYITSLGGVVNTLLSIPVGVIADRVGIKNVFLMNLFLAMLSAILFGLAGSWPIAAIAIVLSMVYFTLNRTVCPMICGSTLSSEERVTGMGICDTISFFPQLIAPIIGASLITYFGGMNVQGMKPLFFLQIVGLAVAFIIVYTRFENPVFQTSSDRKTSVFSDLRVVLAEGIMVRRWILLAMLSNFPWSVMFYVPLFAAEIKGANQFIIGGMSTASTIVLVFLAIPLGHLADTRGRKNVITAAMLLICLSYLVLIYAPSSVFLLLSGFLSGFGMIVGQTQMAIAADLVPKKFMGSWFGILGFFRGIISIFAPILCGLIWDAVSPSGVFFLSIIVLLLNLVVLHSIPTSVTK